MAIHAAMVHLIDEGVGRVVAKLNDLGELDNTLVLFLTDNGASAESGPTGFVNSKRGDPQAKTGTPQSYVSFGIAGANLCDTPFRKYKMYAHEGGIATPLVAHWPQGIPTELKGRLTGDVGHVIDLLPTCLDVAGVNYPSQRNGSELVPVAGVSLTPALRGQSLGSRELFFEHQGNAAARIGKWKIVRQRGDPWELYDIKADRTELNDLAGEQPERVADLKVKWRSWADAVGVKPWPIKK